MKRRTFVKDIHGKEIYEGDVIREGYNGLISYVIYDDEAGTFKLKGLGDTYTIKDAPTEWEILIGNSDKKKAILIHDYDGYVFECPECGNDFRPSYILNKITWKGCPYCLTELDWGDLND